VFIADGWVAECRCGADDPDAALVEPAFSVCVIPSLQNQISRSERIEFSPTVFGWGAGIFFIGYFIFEVPSNLAPEKFGASRWIARIMVTWGIISALMAMVNGEWSFYILRFLLNVERSNQLLIRQHVDVAAGRHKRGFLKPVRAGRVGLSNFSGTRDRKKQTWSEESPRERRRSIARKPSTLILARRFG
jgi:hypothetical protein